MSNPSASKEDLYNSKPSLSPDNVEVGFKNEKKNQSKLYAVFLLFAGLIIIGLIIALAIVVTTKTETETDVCMTDECVKAASMFLESLDTSVKPCDDFYTYACGNWVKKHVIPEEKSTIGVFYSVDDDVEVILKNVLEKKDTANDVESVKKARRYYRSCLDLEKIENLTLSVAHPFLQDIGGWPVLGNKPGGNWNAASFNLEDTLIKLREYTSSPPIMDMYVYDDSKDPLKNVLYIDQPGLGMPSREYYLKGRNDKTLLAYQTYATNIAKLFGADPNTAARDMKAVVDFEIELANLTMPAADRRDEEKLYNPMTIKQLRGNYTDFDWLKYFRSTLRKADNSITVDENEKVIVTNPTYIGKVFRFVRNTPNKTVANYIGWRAIKWMIGALPKSARDFGQVYREALVGTSGVPARWKGCASGMNSEFAMAVGRLFVQEAFDVNARAAALELIESLRVAMKELISESEWMSKNTKKVARDKADHIEPRIGFSDDILKDDVLHEKYNGLEIVEGDYFGSSIKSMKFYSARNLEKLRKPIDRKKWEASPAVVNAYYNPSRNQISFPGGILQPPFFSKKYPKYLNYGGIGYVIGHEITHGFDDSGRMFDRDGNLHPWWDQSAIDQFKKRANCTIDQYSSYVVPEAGKHLNGKLTLGENIADNGGIKESFRAYRTWVKRNGKEEKRLPGLNFSPNQLFFLNAARVWCGVLRPKEAERRIITDPHSNLRFRVIGTMQYSEDFANEFQCPKGSYMNPQQRCKIW